MRQRMLMHKSLQFDTLPKSNFNLPSPSPHFFKLLLCLKPQPFFFHVIQWQGSSFLFWECVPRLFCFQAARLLRELDPDCQRQPKQQNDLSYLSHRKLKLWQNCEKDWKQSGPGRLSFVLMKSMATNLKRKQHSLDWFIFCCRSRFIITTYFLPCYHMDWIGLVQFTNVSVFMNDSVSIRLWQITCSVQICLLQA